MTWLTLILVLSIFLMIEAFFAGSEMALISADRLVLQKLAQAGNSGAKKALNLLDKPEQILGTTLVGTNLCLVFQAVISTLFIYKKYGPEYEHYTIIFLTPIILIFGEILPKTIFQRYSESFAPHISKPIAYARIIFSPITWLLGKYTDKLSRSLSPIEAILTGKSKYNHREELRYLLTYGKNETSLKKSERKMIRRILDFSKAETKRAMIPLVHVDMIEDICTVKEALAAFEKFGHSRLPVYKERVDNVVGILHVIDFFAEKNLEKPIAPSIKHANFAPETQLLEDLLLFMQKNSLEISVVVDEYGGAVGITTLEDILEEVVGEIEDEYDSGSSLYKEITENNYLIQGGMEIDSLNESLRLNIPKGSYETLAGFLLQQFNKIPEDGDELYYTNLKFTIRKATKRAIQSVKLEVIEE